MLEIYQKSENMEKEGELPFCIMALSNSILSTP
jgi:hypothetical protein